MRKILILISALLFTTQVFAQLSSNRLANVEITASCQQETMSVFDIKNLNSYGFLISYSSGESFSGDIYLEPNYVYQLFIYPYSMITFLYNNDIFKQMATNDNLCETPQSPRNNVSVYGLGRSGGINLFSVENKNNVPVTLTGESGSSSKSFEVAANSQVYVVGDGDLLVYYDVTLFCVVSTPNYGMDESSFISATPVCMDATTATFEIRNNHSKPHDAILRNASGTEHRYTLAANSYQTVTVDKCNWDIYLAIPGAVDISGQKIGYNLIVGSVTPANAQLTVSNNTVMADANPYSQNITVTSNATWTVSSDQPWLTLNKTSGNGNEAFILSASANTSGISRTATITVTAGCTVETISVTQGTDPYNALNFDGINDQVTIPDNDATISTAFTIASWVLWQPNSTSDIQFICGKGYEQMEIHTGSANSLRFIPTTGVYLDAANVLPVGKWTHVACVYDATNSTAKMYINGNEVALINNSTNPIGTALQSTATSFFLGSRSSGTYLFKGSLDEFSIWNRALTQGEIQKNRLTSFDPALQTGLISYYKFNMGMAGGSNSGLTSLTDRKGNFNGTLNNFALTGATSNWVESYAMVVPAATAATSVTAAGFTAHWTTPVVGKADNYLLEVATDSAFVNLLTSYDPLSAADTFAVVSGLASETTYYYRVRADKASLIGEGAWSNSIQVVTSHYVPINLVVSDTTIASGEACFNATNEITVSKVTVEASASADFIAGSSVTFLPSFNAESGSYVHAWITETASFCDAAGGSPIVENPAVKSAENKAVAEKQTNISGEKTVKVYPNPNNGQFTLELTNIESGATVCIYNMLGARVYQSSAMNEEIRKIDMPGLRKGIYLVRIVSGNSQITKKIIVK